jgi:prepilin peptidase CpaA
MSEQMQPDTLALVLALAGTVTGAAIDVRTRRVPNVVTGAFAGIGLLVALSGAGHIGLVAALAGCATGLALMLPGYVLGGTGAGDVKLLAAAGTVLGPEATAWAFAYTLMAGGSLALVVAAIRGRLWVTCWRTVDLVRTGGANSGDIRALGEGNRFAYAPAIAIGVVTAVVLS